MIEDKRNDAPSPTQAFGRDEGTGQNVAHGESMADIQRKQFPLGRPDMPR